MPVSRAALQQLSRAAAVPAEAARSRPASSDAHTGLAEGRKRETPGVLPPIPPQGTGRAMTAAEREARARVDSWLQNAVPLPAPGAKPCLSGSLPQENQRDEGE